MLTTEKILEVEPRLKDFMDLFWDKDRKLPEDLHSKVVDLGRFILSGATAIADSNLSESLSETVPCALVLLTKVDNYEEQGR